MSTSAEKNSFYEWLLTSYELEAAITLTEKSLENLKSEGVPNDVIIKLETIKNQEISGKKKFFDVLKSTIGNEQTLRYKALILKHVSLRVHDDRGRSPLDIPTRTIISSFVKSLLFSLLVGHMVILSLNACSKNDLEEERNKFIGVSGSERSSPDSLYYTIINELLPNQTIKEGDSIFVKFKDDVIKSFGQEKRSFDALFDFLKSTSGRNLTQSDKDRFASAIVGDLTWGWSVFFEQSGNDILGLFKIPKSHKKIPHTDHITWRRNLLISGIIQLRGELTKEYFYARRVLQGLAGGIQWLTFVLSVWCLFLIIFLRTPWVKLQMQLVTKGRLPWNDPNDPDFWQTKLPPGKTPLFYTLRQNYPGIFVPVRLLQEVIIAKKSQAGASLPESGDKANPAPSTRDIIRERIAAYRDSVDQGEYELINFLIWAIPTCGFLGTILGIIGAMENAANIVRASNVIEQASAIKQVSGYLGTAFDTTFVALIWVLPLSYLLAIVRKMEANLFERLEFEANLHLPALWEDAAISSSKNKGER